MGAPSIGEVVLVPFPFSDLSAAKVRPQSSLTSQPIIAAIAAGLALFIPVLQADDRARAENRSLQLTVLDDHDAPVPGAKVTVRIRQESGGSWDVTRSQCDERGQLHIDVPAAAPAYFAVRVELPGYAPFWAEWNPQDTPPDPVPDSFTARLDPGRLIGGIVQDEDGKPVRGAKVSPGFNLKMREERTFPLGAGVNVTTDDEGRWTYPSFPAANDQLTISISHPNYAAIRITEPTSKFALAPGGAPSGVSVIKPGIAIRGTVTDGDGKPITGATVIYHELSQGDRPQANTDKDGSYRIANGEAGDTFLTASAEGWAPSIKTVRIEPSMGDVDFQLSRGKPLRVRTIDSKGEPVTDVHITLWTWQEHQVYGALPGSQGKTDAKGVWEWKNAPAGAIRFAISKSGFAYIREQELTIGTEENVVTMQPEAPEESRVLKVSGRVIDAETKQPIARFRVTPGDQQQGRATISWYHQNQSESRDGRYQRDFTPNMTTSTRHALRINADGYLPAISRVFNDDEEEITIDFELTPGKDSSFVVLTPEGEPAKVATVAICTPEVGPIITDGDVLPNSTCERMSTSADGRFSLAPREGIFALMILHESGAAYVSQLALRDSNTIELAPWARIEGVLRIRGKPAANEPVTLHRDDAAERNAPKVHYSDRTTTDNEGRFSFDRVVPGAGQVQRNVVSKLDGGASMWIPTHVANARFPAGETTNVDLSREGKRIKGRLVVPKDLEKVNDWRSAMVSLRLAPPAIPPAPQIPFPDGIDPAKDREAAMKWWEKWKDTEEGQAFQLIMKRHQAAAQAISLVRSPSFNAKVEPDGSFAFDDISPGAYQLTAHAQSRPENGRFGPGRFIANLTHQFTVEYSEDDSRDTIELAELEMQPARN